jgi:hypothetical protein
MALRSWPTDYYEQLMLLDEIRNNANMKCNFTWQSDRDGQTHSCGLPFGHRSRIHTSDETCICGGRNLFGEFCNMKKRVEVPASK